MAASNQLTRIAVMLGREMTGEPPPSRWPAETRRVYLGLKSYEIVGASTCAAAIVGALEALAEADDDGDLLAVLRDAGSAFRALKPSTAAYANVVDWLLRDTEDLTAGELRGLVARRAQAFADYRSSSVEAIADAGCSLLRTGSAVLIHDYSSTVLSVLAEAGRRGLTLKALVTAGEPVGKGAHVAQLAADAGHTVTFASDSSTARLVQRADLFLTGVETLFQSGDLANTVGTYPISLLAREHGVPVYGATECLKIHPTQQTASLDELTAELLKPWPADAAELPPGAEIDVHVLDLTPAALLAGLVTEQGILAPSETEAALARLRVDLDGRL
jgi:translation initiation factor 2B subunit (eIF-2B alpha/beta/delta family)